MDVRLTTSHREPVVETCGSDSTDAVKTTATGRSAGWFPRSATVWSGKAPTPIPRCCNGRLHLHGFRLYRTVLRLHCRMEACIRRPLLFRAFQQPRYPVFLPLHVPPLDPECERSQTSYSGELIIRQWGQLYAQIFRTQYI